MDGTLSTNIKSGVDKTEQFRIGCSIRPLTGTRTDLRKEENLLAVVVTDSFDHKFEILTEEKPKCLLPLANKEMIDYTLEFLQSSFTSPKHYLLH